MKWIADYKSKLTTAEQAVKLVQSNDRVYLSGNAAAPYPWPTGASSFNGSPSSNSRTVSDARHSPWHH
jgi:hypothetical protein